MKKHHVIYIFFFNLPFADIAYGQFTYGTTGLLHMPTADMQRDKTVMTGASYLDVAAAPGEWSYNTWNYYLNLTIFPWLEVGYVCTLLKMAVPELQLHNKFRNQDRHFAVRLRLWKESWWKPWTPQVVLGTNDPGMSSHSNGFGSASVTGNDYWNRYYLAMSKHFSWKKVADIGVHVAYLYNRRELNHYNGLVIGANLRFNLPESSFGNKL